MEKTAFIFTKNIKSEYIGCNQDFAEAVGLLSNREIIGSTDFDFHWDKSHAKLYRQRDKMVFQGKPLIHFVESHPLRTGELKTVIVNKTPIYNAKGSITGLACYFHMRQTDMPKLTTIQTKCLHYLVCGYTAKQIARLMFLSHRTVEAYIANLKKKLLCDNKTQLIAKALPWFNL